MKYYSDYSDLQEALAKVDKFGAVTFNSAKTGNMIFEETQVEMYNKIQKLLNCDAMESAHGYLYNLDPEELTEAEASKVNNLWKLGCEKGFIEDFAEDEEAEKKEDVDECAAVQAQASNLTPATPAQQQVAANALQAMRKQDAFTVLYSAMRDGSVKTGEAYSNAINPRSAKMDVISQLERAGYSNISILAIECGDPDCCGADCSNTYVKQADTAPVATETPVDAIPDYAADDGSAFEAEEDKDDSEENVNEAQKFDIRAELKKKFGSDSLLPSYDVKELNKQDMFDYTMILQNAYIDLKQRFNDTDSKETSELLKKQFDSNSLLPSYDVKDLSGNDAFDYAMIIQNAYVDIKKKHNLTEADDAEKADDKEADKEDAADDKKEEKSEKAEEPDEKLKDDADAEKKAADAEDDEKLDAAEKTALKDSYKKAFKAAMLKCKFEDRAFNDLSLEEKIEFFTALSTAWGSKADPSKFMEPKEVEQLEKIKVKK